MEHVEHLEALNERRIQARDLARAATTTGTATIISVPVTSPLAEPTYQPPKNTQPTYSGDYSCTGLEALWDEAGGSVSAAFIAAEIATAESGGNPNAISPTDDFGLWQINGSHGSLATLNPLGNARAAVAISSDGTDWSPWTTYTAGLYIGRC